MLFQKTLIDHDKETRGHLALFSNCFNVFNKKLRFSMENKLSLAKISPKRLRLEQRSAQKDSVLLGLAQESSVLKFNFKSD